MDHEFNMDNEYNIDFPEIEPFDITTYLEEQLVLIYFNLTRKENTENTDNLAKMLTDVLEFIKTNLQNKKEEVKPFLSLFFRLIGETRSIISDEYSAGKGENELTYMMISVWYDIFPDLTRQLLLPCFTIYGSWRDAPYLCEYIRKKKNNKYHSLIDIVIDLANKQLYADLESWKFSTNAFSRNHISNIAKWIPRENKKLDWLHSRFTYDWAKKQYSYIIDTAQTDESYEKAMMKCKRIYRKTYSLLNKALDTIQIKQCSQNTANIDSKNISPLTEMKQTRTLTRLHSISENINDFSGCRTVLPISYFIKEAYLILSTGSQLPCRIDRLNKQWDQYSGTISSDGFANMLPMVDVSWSAQPESFYSAMGLAVLVAERTSYGKRILAYGSNAVWINMEADTTFFSMIQTIYENIQSIQYTTSEIHKAFSLIHTAVEETKRENTLFDIKEKIYLKTKLPKLVIFSNNFEGLDKYEMPIRQKLILWNTSMTTTKILPCKFNQRNYILLSGISGGLISNFRVLKKYSKNRAYTPYSFIHELLMQPQYECLFDQ